MRDVVATDFGTQYGRLAGVFGSLEECFGLHKELWVGKHLVVLIMYALAIKQIHFRLVSLLIETWQNA